ENILLEVANNIIRGLLLGYSGLEMKKMSTGMYKTIPALIKITGFFNFLKMLPRFGINYSFPEIGTDEFFISNIAVFPAYRGKKIGLNLLKKAIEIAQEKQLKKLSLYVETNNTHAIEIYRKFGFAETDKIDLPEKYRQHHIYGFCKMIKNIS
ncbi:MAG: GNAT family N-acetyltransferase, partial [Spirochaetes bacterium]|nr:GNAT family N-acetyltransferase [Spirochaetota bacterium]